MADYVNHKFVDQVVELDGNSFDGCAFEGCVIHYHGGPVNIRNGINLKVENRIEFKGAALATWKMLHFLSAGAGIDLARFNPDPDV